MGTRAVTRSPTRNLARGLTGFSWLSVHKTMGLPCLDVNRKSRKFRAQKNTSGINNMKVYIDMGLGVKFTSNLRSHLKIIPKNPEGTCSFRVSLAGQLLMAATLQRRCQPSASAWIMTATT